MGINVVEVMQTEGVFQCGESVFFEADVMLLYAVPCIVMESSLRWIVAWGV